MERKLEHLGLPPEIIYEILADLPVKPLARFRCVSKLWNSLISDSSFQHEHYRRRLQQDPLLLIATTYSDSVDTLDLSTYDANDRTGITNFTIPFPVPPSSLSCGSIQICRGLACVALVTDVFVCNPATREIISLPSFVKEPIDCVGFGYAPSTNQFKVVRFFGNTFSDRAKNCCEIFTLGTSQWREARCPTPDSFSKFSLHAPFLHGAIHFLSDSEDHSADDAIYALDIESEQYTKIPLPKYYYVARELVLSFDWEWQCLNEFRGSLYLTSNSETSMHLWFLKDYNSGKWVKDYVIDLPQSFSKFLWGQPLAIIGDGSILLRFFPDMGNEQIWWYNLGDKTFQETSMEDYSATMYVESLLPLDNKGQKSAQEELNQFLKEAENYFAEVGETIFSIPIPSMLCTNDSYSDSLVISQEDIVAVIQLEELTTTVINLYASFIYTHIQVETIALSEVFQFINITDIMWKTGDNPDDTSAIKIAMTLKTVERSKVVFMMFNPGRHWILVVIIMSDWTMFYLDPLHYDVNIIFEKWLRRVLNEVKSMVPNPGYPRKLKIHNVKGPKQPDQIQCSYYSLRNMWEIVTDDSGNDITEMPFITERRFKRRPLTYSAEEIDEIRLQYINHIRRNQPW